MLVLVPPTSAARIRDDAVTPAYLVAAWVFFEVSRRPPTPIPAPRRPPAGPKKPHSPRQIAALPEGTTGRRRRRPSATSPPRSGPRAGLEQTGARPRRGLRGRNSPWRERPRNRVARLRLPLPDPRR